MMWVLCVYLWRNANTHHTQLHKQSHIITTILQHIFLGSSDFTWHTDEADPPFSPLLWAIYPSHLISPLKHASISCSLHWYLYQFPSSFPHSSFTLYSHWSHHSLSSNHLITLVPIKPRYPVTTMIFHLTSEDGTNKEFQNVISYLIYMLCKNPWTKKY
jgi:hypothetical protein